jgi:hypothetical protein
MRLVNPLVRRLVARGFAPDQLLVLHLHGRRTGRVYDVPVGYHLVDGAITVLTDSAWRHNLAEPTEVAATVRGVRQSYRADRIDDPSAVAGVFATLVDRLGVSGASRRLGLRVHHDGPPTRDELLQLVQRSGVVAVRLRSM